jgi:hypothetical protein
VAGLTYFVSDGGAEPNHQLAESYADTIPHPSCRDGRRFSRSAAGRNENQSHVGILVHGFNVSFDHSTTFYETFCGKLFDGPGSRRCILYDWPSFGTVVGYEPDRSRPRLCRRSGRHPFRPYDWLLKETTGRHQVGERRG